MTSICWVNKHLDKWVAIFHYYEIGNGVSHCDLNSTRRSFCFTSIKANEQACYHIYIFGFSSHWALSFRCPLKTLFIHRTHFFLCFLDLGMYTFGHSRVHSPGTFISLVSFLPMWPALGNVESFELGVIMSQNHRLKLNFVYAYIWVSVQAQLRKKVCVAFLLLLLSLMA